MRSTICISCSSVLAVGAFLAAATPATDRAPAAVAADPRPVVAVRVAIESEAYRQYFGERLDAAARWLADTCHALLTQHFGFVNWAAPAGSALDTVVVRWFESGDRPRHVFLEIGLRGQAGGVTPFRTMFERFSQLGQRSDWTPAGVRSGWGRALDSILASSTGGLVAELLGALPLAAPVVLYPRDLQAHVQLTPLSIHAADRPRPQFRVKVTMDDPGPPLPTSDEAELLLGGCRPHPSGTYVCDVVWLTYQDTTVLARDRQQLIERSQMQHRSLHVRAYKPAGRDAPVVAIGPP